MEMEIKEKLVKLVDSLRLKTKSSLNYTNNVTKEMKSLIF